MLIAKTRGGKCDQDIIWFLQISSSETQGSILATKTQEQHLEVPFLPLENSELMFCGQVNKRQLSNENIINFNIKRLSHETTKSSWENNGKARANYITHGVNKY